MKFRKGCNWKLVYADYLEHCPHWKEKKAECTAYYGGLCALCGDIGTECHHTADGYNYLFEEIVGQHIYLLCDVCHAKQHNKYDLEEYCNNPDKLWQRMAVDNDILGYDTEPQRNPIDGKNESLN